MTQAHPKAELSEEILSCLEADKGIRRRLPSGAQLHIDRPLPFICVHQTPGDTRQAAEDVVAANASYLISPDLGRDMQTLNSVGRAMIDRFGAFLVIEVSEFDQDALLSEDSPDLPEFEIALETEARDDTRAALEAAAAAIESVDVKYRSPAVSRRMAERKEGTALAGLDVDIGLLSVRFAPIYRQPDSDAVYTGLRERLVAHIFDALLEAAAAFSHASGAMQPKTHRALGRRAFVDAVRKLDRQMDAVSESFDFLMAVTPINSLAAWERFRDGGRDRAPKLLYRPLTIEIDEQKRALHAIAFDNLEDPLLAAIYRDRQQELDLQLTAINLRDTPRFREASRLLYGPVEIDLLEAARDILARPLRAGKAAKGEGGLEGHADCYELRDAACQMIADYKAAYAGFDAEVVIRDDLPAGMMVSGRCLMISRSTRLTRGRLQALLSHEIGVHLMTYFTGDAQGLRIFRSGLAGYEGIQEGLAVFAEYLVGGLTAGRLRLLAARVVGCAAMLEGADFVETYRMLTRDHGFSDSAAFNLTVRLYRSGGLAKDAIYLRGLLDVLEHLRSGRPLAPYWLGKFAKSQFPQIEELAARGLLRTPPIAPAFLTGETAEKRLAAARAGLTPADLISG